MTVRPILFSAPMVQALLDGRKTQTRRVLKDMPDAPAADNLVHAPKHDAPYFDAYCGGRKTDANPRGMTDHWCWWTRDDRQGHGRKVPYVPGDRLYVREAWAPLSACTTNDPGSQALAERGFYRADNATVDGEISRWRPGIHMPRWASRLTLTVTDVRVERLQNCSEADAIAEGIHQWRHHPIDGEPFQAFKAFGREQMHRDPRLAYRDLWDSINGVGAWESNPWVVAVSFTVEQRNIDNG